MKTGKCFIRASVSQALGKEDVESKRPSCKWV